MKKSLELKNAMKLLFLWKYGWYTAEEKTKVEDGAEKVIQNASWSDKRMENKIERLWDMKDRLKAQYMCENGFRENRENAR